MKQAGMGGDSLQTAMWKRSRNEVAYNDNVVGADPDHAILMFHAHSHNSRVPSP